MEVCAITMTKIEDWLETIPSKNTRKNYVNGISKFETWYEDSITKLIKSPDATKMVEKFYVYLKQRHPQNTCRNVTNAVIQFLKYHGTDVRPRKALGIYRTERALDNHILTISEVQEMAKVADLREQVILGVLLLGFRVGDTIRLKKSDFNLNGEPPIELKLRATKEGTIYETFISEELKELLAKYIPTLESEWLFNGVRKGSHVKDETLNNRLRNLAKRAGIHLNGRLTWHCGRKLLMRTGAELGLNAWNIKRIMGKSIPISDDTYLAGLKLREDFIKLGNTLRLRPGTNKANGRITKLTEAVDLVLRVQRKMVLRELQKEQQGGDYLGVMVDYSRLSHKEILEEYLKIKKKGES